MPGQQEGFRVPLLGLTTSSENLPEPITCSGLGMYSTKSDKRVNAIGIHMHRSPIRPPDYRQQSFQVTTGRKWSSQTQNDGHQGTKGLNYPERRTTVTHSHWKSHITEAAPHTRSYRRVQGRLRHLDHSRSPTRSSQNGRGRAVDLPIRCL
jgi:hypothetical protein